MFLFNLFEPFNKFYINTLIKNEQDIYPSWVKDEKYYNCEGFARWFFGRK